MKKLLGLLAGGVLVFAATLTDSSVVAKVNGHNITVKELNNFIAAIAGDTKIKFQDIPAPQRINFLKQYIDTMIFYKKAKSVENTPEFKALKKKLAVDIWLKEKLANIKVSDKEIQDFYNQNKDIYFKSEPKVKARHILVKDEKEAEKLINELKGLKGKALEEKFAELAKKYSTGPTKINGGELGWFSPKQMVPAFAKAVESLKPGEITLKPVKTRFGYHIILVEDKNKNAYVPLDKVKAQIIEYLKRVKLQKELQKLRDKENIKILLK